MFPRFATCRHARHARGRLQGGAHQAGLRFLVAEQAMSRCHHLMLGTSSSQHLMFPAPESAGCARAGIGWQAGLWFPVCLAGYCGQIAKQVRTGRGCAWLRAGRARCRGLARGMPEGEAEFGHDVFGVGLAGFR